MNRPPRASRRLNVRPSRQKGVTLIELMVGLAIGLLVVAVAVSAVIVSRGISGTVSDASDIQQQGSFVLRTLGQQLRQTGSLYLNTDPTQTAVNDPHGAVVFEIRAAAQGSGNSFDQKTALSGSADSLTTAFRRYSEPVFSGGTDYLARNCVGAPVNTSTDQRVESTFTFANNELLCAGNGQSAQPLARNVANVEARYVVQSTTATGSAMQYLAASDIPAGFDWRNVQAIQVCVVLYGSEPVDMPAGATYADCDGTLVDMTTLPGARRKRLHIAFKDTFQLRSQGLL